VLGNDRGSLIASASGAGAPQQNRLSKDEVEFLSQYFNDQKPASSASKPTKNIRKLLPSSSFGPLPGITVPPSGRTSTVGGFDAKGNSLNGAQFDLGKSWVADLPKLPWNLGVSTIEGGINLLSAATPGAPDYIPFLSPARLPYNSELSEYAEFGLGLAFIEGRSSTSRSTGLIEDAVARKSIDTLGGELTDAVKTRAIEISTQGTPEYLPNNRRGPVLTGVMDSHTQEIFWGMNKDATPIDLHPLLQQRLDSYLEFTGGGKYSRKGGHRRSPFGDCRFE